MSLGDLQLDGVFTITDGRFASPGVQTKINELSRENARARRGTDSQQESCRNLPGGSRSAQVSSRYRMSHSTYLDRRFVSADATTGVRTDRLFGHDIH